jgi:hypothetical protein
LDNGIARFHAKSGIRGNGGLFESNRYLFAYRGNYIDYLNIAETYLAEGNYSDALSTISYMYELFEIIEEDSAELIGLETYTYWLQQLETEQQSIYTLSEQKLNYLIDFVETNTGQGVVFAKIILCDLYNICIEDEEETPNYAPPAPPAPKEPIKNEEVSEMENITTHVVRHLRQQSKDSNRRTISC